MTGVDPIMAFMPVGQLPLFNKSFGQVTLFNPSQDPVLHLSFYPANATFAQQDHFWESTFSYVLVDGRPGQTGRIDDVFQANDSHERGSSVRSKDWQDL